MRAGLILAILFLLGPGLGGQTNNVDELLAAEMEMRHMPGAVIAIIRNGQIVQSRAYGFADIDRSVPVTMDTVFPIGSVTKQFTAAATLMLVAEGKIGLDRPISSYLPQVPTAYRNVTVRHVLSHTSGIGRDFRSDDQSIGRPSLVGPALYAAMTSRAPDFAPGEKASYSNTGFILLGSVIEAVAETTYSEFLARRIFAPLKMTATRVAGPGDTVPGLATGYEWRNGTYRRIPYTLTRYGAGSIVSTIGDLAKWVIALETNQLLTPAAHAQMWSPATLNNGSVASLGYDFAIRKQSVGFGWFIGDYLGHKVIFHGGGVDGYSSQVDYFVDDKIAVIVLANNEAGPAVSLAKILADNYVPRLDQEGVWPINQRAHFAQQQRRYAEAARLYVLGLEKGDRDPENAYYAARCFALTGDTTQAFAFLERALALGFKDLNLITTDRNIDSLRSDPRWLPVVTRVKGALR